MTCLPLFPLLQEMTSEEKSKITDLKKCNFNEMGEFFKAQSEARKAMTKDDKLVSKNNTLCFFLHLSFFYNPVQTTTVQ